MILMTLLNICSLILDSIFGTFFDLLPGWGDGLNSIANTFLTIVDNGCSMFYFLFGPVATVLVVYVGTMEILKHALDLLMWVIRKIPLSID